MTENKRREYLIGLMIVLVGLVLLQVDVSARVILQTTATPAVATATSTATSSSARTITTTASRTKGAPLSITALRAD